MEPNYSLPETGLIQLDKLTISQAKMLARKLEAVLHENKEDPSLTGVSLFELKPNTQTLEAWNPWEHDAYNGAMKGSYSQFHRGDFSAVLHFAREYCKKLLTDSGVIGYFHGKSNSLIDCNVIIHLHYYRNRVRPDPGFHKDTRGQTLFFLLHYLNERGIYGAEWMRQHDQLRRVHHQSGRLLVQNQQGEVVVLSEEQEMQLEQGSTLPKGWNFIYRQGPTDVKGIWPKAIRNDVNVAKTQEADDDKIHVLRVDPYGAAIIVDDIFHHRTPNPFSRDQWGMMMGQLPQVSSLQARDVYHKQGLYEIPRGRSRHRTPPGKRGSSRSRSMSREREGNTDQERWEATFLDPNPRKFFRIWVTVSPKNQKVWY